jgi:hypothetical protein
MPQTRRMTNSAAGIGSVSTGRRYGLGVSSLEDRHYLYILIALELAGLYALRYGFRRYHGG